MSDQQLADAWEDAEKRYQSGQEVQGTVTRVAQFGVFAQVEPGIEGIIYTFELGPTSAALAGFAPGQEMTLYVKTTDASRKRLELSLSPALALGLADEKVLPAHLRRQPFPSELETAHEQLAGLFTEQTGPSSLSAQEKLRWRATHPSAEKNGAALACPTCQRSILAGWKFCVYCGGTLQRSCLVCGSAQPDLPDAHFCPACGAPV